MVTSIDYTLATVASRKTLDRYWPEHPPVDVIHCETVPPDHPNSVHWQVGQQGKTPWTLRLLRYLTEYCRDPLVLLWLDDYLACGPINHQRIVRAGRVLLADDSVGCVHLTYQPVSGDQRLHHGRPCGGRETGGWAYSVNTQAAIWSRQALIRVCRAVSQTMIEGFELQGSAWLNGSNAFTVLEAPQRTPAAVPGYVDAMDKADWLTPYRNAYRRGQLSESQHGDFIDQEGLRQWLPRKPGKPD
jgi:hypothetical protein